MHECPRCRSKGARESVRVADALGILTVYGETTCWLCDGGGLVEQTDRARWRHMTRGPL